MENISNNIIKFPKENKNIQKAITPEEVNHNIELMNHYHIQETISNIIPMIFNQLDIAGFYFSDYIEEENDIYAKDGTLLSESLRSLLCKYYDIDHPFQKIAENVFETIDIDEKSVRIVDKLDITLKENQSEE